MLSTGWSGSFQNNNFHCSQCWKVSQNDDISISVQLSMFWGLFGIKSPAATFLLKDVLVFPRVQTCSHTCYPFFWGSVWPGAPVIGVRAIGHWVFMDWWLVDMLESSWDFSTCICACICGVHTVCTELKPINKIQMLKNLFVLVIEINCMVLDACL